MTRPGTLAGGCVAGFAVSWNIANTGPVASVLASHYGVALGTVGLFAAVTFLAELVEMLPVGRAIDRFGPKRCALAALALCLAGNLGTTAGGGIVVALALRFLTGLGVGLGFVAGSLYVQSGAGGASPAAQGIYGGMSLSGGGVALGLVPLLDGAFGWRAPFWSGAAIALAGFALVAAAPATAGARRGAAVSTRALLRDRSLARFGLLHSVSFGFSVIIGNWVVTLLERTAGYSRSAAGAVGALTLLGGIVGRPLGGWLTRGRDPRALLVGAVLGGGAATGLLAAAPSRPLDIVAAAVIGVCAGLPFGAVVSGATRAQPTAPGAAVGVMNIYPVATIVAGAPLVGLGFLGGAEGRAGFVVLAVLWAAAALAVPGVRGPAPRAATPRGDGRPESARRSRRRAPTARP